jgi:hypothetical protein
MPGMSTTFISYILITLFSSLIFVSLYFNHYVLIPYIYSTARAGGLRGGVCGGGGEPSPPAPAA